MTKRMLAGKTGSVMIDAIDAEAIVTRDRTDTARSKALVEDYARAYAAGDALPPIDVYDVGGQLVLVDGAHRLLAQVARRARSVVVRCVGAGTALDALRHALTSSNHTHGQRLSTADQAVRVRLALDSGLWDSTPGKTLAADLHVRVETVREVMARWEAERSDAGAPPPPAVVRAHGRPAPRHTRHAPRITSKPIVSAESKEKAAPRTEPDEPDEPAAPSLPGYGPALESSAARVRQTRIATLAEVPDVDALRSVRQRVEQLLRDAEACLTLARPVVCARCGGGGCKSCGGRGWRTALEAGK